MSTINTDLSHDYKWVLRKNAHNTFTITVTQSSSAFDLSSYTFTLNIRRQGASTNALQLTQGSGITNGGATGILTIDVTSTQAGTTLVRDTYFYELIYAVNSKTYGLIHGIMEIKSGVNSENSTSSLSLSVSLAGTNVSAAITLATALTSASIVSALGYTPANAAGNRIIQVACSDETTALTAGTGKITFRMPHAMTLSAVRASLTTAQTSGNILTVDINDGGTSVLSAKLTIDNGEKTSTTAATAAVISDTALADDAEITVDIDQIGDGTAAGLKITLIGS